MKKVICKSGLRGYQSKLQDGYANFEEFKAFSDTYGLAKRLGYKNAKTAWKANPTIQGSIEPSDFRKVTVNYPCLKAGASWFSELDLQST